MQDWLNPAVLNGKPVNSSHQNGDISGFADSIRQTSALIQLIFHLIRLQSDCSCAESDK